MNIAVNTRFLLSELEGCGYFIREVFTRIAADHPEHRFFFIFDRPYALVNSLPANVEPIIAGPPARHPVLWKYWYDLKMPRLLRKIKADLFVSPDGYASLNTSIAQCLVVHDLGFLHEPDAYKRSHLFFLKRFTPRYLRKVQRIATVSFFSKEDLVHQYKTDADRIDVVYNGVKDIFSPAEHDQQEAVRSRFTEGKAYFLYAGAIQPRKNLVGLLKAFSIFKKRQQSDMKLVLAGRMAWKNENFLQLLKTYKYRQDVVLTGYLEETDLAALMASAYAMVYPSFFEGFGVPVLEAMKSGVPAITTANSSMQEIAGDAGLYFDPHNIQDMAEKMMLVYKDENLRKNMVEKGIQRAAGFTWAQTSQLMWDSMMKAMEVHEKSKKGRSA